jgi:ABC-2 type transport system permease protein
MTNIHDQGYRRYGGGRTPHGRAWWVIARTQFRAALKFRPFVVLLLFSCVPFIARGVQFYLASSFQQVSMLAPTAQTFREFLDQQRLFVFLLTIALGGAIADDRRANALQLYLSRPLTRVEYVLGRLVPSLICLLGITFLPAMLLLLLQVAFSGSTAFLRQNLFLVPAITLVSLTQALLSSFTILALSSLSKSRRFVAVMYAGIIFFTTSMYQVLRSITGSRAWAAISPGEMMNVLADAVFRIRSTPPVPVPVAILVIVLLIGVSIWILERRIRAVEIVA